MTWKAVGEQFGISAGMAYRVAVKGYKPNRKAIRDRLRGIVPHQSRPRRTRKARNRLNLRQRVAWVRSAAEWLRERDAERLTTMLR